MRTFREKRGLSLAALGKTLGMTAQGVWRWENGRAQIPSATVPALAESLGVTICELYGVEESHSFVAASAGVLLSAEKLKLAQVLGVEPDRIEVNIYAGAGTMSDVRGTAVDGSPLIIQAKSAQVTPSPAQEFVPTAADRDTRDILRAWDAMPAEVQREWLEAAEAIRREKSQK